MVKTNSLQGFIFIEKSIFAFNFMTQLKSKNIFHE